MFTQAVIFNLEPALLQFADVILWLSWPLPLCIKTKELHTLGNGLLPLPIVNYDYIIHVWGARLDSVLHMAVGRIQVAKRCWDKFSRVLIFTVWGSFANIAKICTPRK